MIEGHVISRSAVIDTLGRRVVAPSMLKCDFGHLADEVRALEKGGASVLHWDVMDGHFVANLTYGPPVLKSVRRETDLVFDAHLMVRDPAALVDDYVDAGCNAITIHIEAAPDPVDLLRRIRAADVACGLALNPATPVSRVEPFLGECDLVLVMSVDPGFGGQAFQPVALEKLRRLRELVADDVVLSVDGGIGPRTIREAADAGANLFVCGSAVFDAEDYGTALGELTALAADSLRSPSAGG